MAQNIEEQVPEEPGQEHQEPVAGSGEHPLPVDPARSQGQEDSDVATRLLDIGRIQPNPHQARTEFKEEEMAELTASIQRDGQLQPIVVRPLASGQDDQDTSYQIIMGERRYRAALNAGWTKIQAIVRETEDNDVLRLSLVENVQRVDLNAVDKGAALKRLKELNPGLAWWQIGALLGLTEQSIHNLVGLLKLPSDIQQEIREGVITEKHGRALRRLPEVQQRLLLQQIKDEKLTGPETLARAQQMKAQPSTAPPPGEVQAGAEQDRLLPGAGAEALEPVGRDQIEMDQVEMDVVETEEIGAGGLAPREPSSGLIPGGQGHGEEAHRGQDGGSREAGQTGTAGAPTLPPLLPTPKVDADLALAVVERHAESALNAVRTMQRPQMRYQSLLKPRIDRIRMLLDAIDELGTR